MWALGRAVFALPTEKASVYDLPEIQEIQGRVLVLEPVTVVAPCDLVVLHRVQVLKADRLRSKACARGVTRRAIRGVVGR